MILTYPCGIWLIYHMHRFHRALCLLDKRKTKGWGMSLTWNWKLRTNFIFTSPGSILPILLQVVEGQWCNSIVFHWEMLFTDRPTFVNVSENPKADHHLIDFAVSCLSGKFYGFNQDISSLQNLISFLKREPQELPSSMTTTNGVNQI